MGWLVLKWEEDRLGCFEVGGMGWLVLKLGGMGWLVLK